MRHPVKEAHHLVRITDRGNSHKLDMIFIVHPTALYWLLQNIKSKVVLNLTPGPIYI